MSSSQAKTPPILFQLRLQLAILLIILLSVSVEASDNGYAWQDSSTNVSPSTSIVIIVLVLGFFITGSIFIYIQHCVATPASTTTTTTRGITANNAVRGLDKSLINTFPEFQYSAVKELKLGKGALECAVCLSEFEDDETLRFLPKCDHVFHSECIDTWLEGHHTCPVCRDDLAIVSDKPDPTLPISNDEVQIAIPAQDTHGRLPRSHSTGHSLVEPGEVQERFTLRLPTEVRRQLVARAKLRAMSLVVLPRQSSSRKGYRTAEGSGSSRYSRFFGRSFTMTMRMPSFKSTAKIGIHGDLTPASKLDRDFPHPSLPL